jgi:signal transduction histidine kinase
MGVGDAVLGEGERMSGRSQIFIVDDNAVNVTILEEILRDEFELIKASSGEEALEQLKAHRPDLILLDIMMPGIDGYETCRRIRQDPEHRFVKIILVSAKALTAERLEGYAAGADDYVTKPFDADEMVAKVKVFLRLKNSEELEAEKEQRAQELALLNDQLRAARAAADAANEAKTHFLANMSHEVRTPMTAIIGFAETLLDPGLDESERGFAVEVIHQNGEHLLQIINDILDVSKIEAGKLEVEQIDCSPMQIVSDVQSLMGVRAEEKNLNFAIEYIGQVPETIKTDPTRLRQIFINLVGNAIKFTSSGDVRLVARFSDPEDPGQSQPMMVFDVIDNGIGMTDEQVGRLFRPFVQADPTTTRRFGGTGLGLTISKHLAEYLGGDITVSSKPGEGSTFRVAIPTGPIERVRMVDPVTGAVIDDGASGEAPAEEKEDPLEIRLDCRVLVAEDFVANQKLIEYVLGKAGAQITLVENGQLAVDAALEAKEKGTPFDVILMDMQMPVLNGYQATSMLRRRGYSGPILALTAHAMSTDAEKCLNAGCDGYATKPIDRAGLLQLVRHHSERRAAA